MSQCSSWAREAEKLARYYNYIPYIGGLGPYPNCSLPFDLPDTVTIYVAATDRNHSMAPIDVETADNARQEPVLLKRKINKENIGYPTDFRHIFHASTFEEASEVLLRWSFEGVHSKLGDPAWAVKVQSVVQLRAREQQARVTAASQEATLRLRGNGVGLKMPQPGELHVVNGLPSSIYSTFNTTRLSLFGGRADGSDEIGVKTITNNAGSARLRGLFEPFPSSPPVSGTSSSLSSRSESLFLFDSQNQSASKHFQIKQKSDPTVSSKDELDLIAREIAALPDGLPRYRQPQSIPVLPVNQLSESTVPFRIIKPSLETLEKAMSLALYFEQHYYQILKTHPGKGDIAEKDMRGAGNLRSKRTKVQLGDFELGRVIGHGAFGVVKIARENSSGTLMAIKQMKKAEMLRRSQEGHIRAEKDIMAAAARDSVRLDEYSHSWIVKLHYAFQDIENLYMVMEYMGGGDLLNLLQERDTLSESMTRFYVAEMILGLHQTHSLGYIHRDIKPDNFLFGPDGHLKISDFGLSTDLHWTHDTRHLEERRAELLKKHGVDLAYPEIRSRARLKQASMGRDMELATGEDFQEGLLTRRDRNRREMAYSVCGTNSYMAPEVIRGEGYDYSCDWWSLGIIMFECLYGYPPFTSRSRIATRQRILDWKRSLRIPRKPPISPDCKDFLLKLLCEPEDRLGYNTPEAPHLPTSTMSRRQRQKQKRLTDGVERVKAHPWLDDIDWDILHRLPAPYQPALVTEDDTRHFETDIPDHPLLPPSTGVSRDPMLGDEKHGAKVLEIRKQLAFKGWTFRAPRLNAGRRGSLPEWLECPPPLDRKVAIDVIGDEENGSSPEDEAGWTGTVHRRALST